MYRKREKVEKEKVSDRRSLSNANPAFISSQDTIVMHIALSPQVLPYAPISPIVIYPTLSDSACLTEQHHKVRIEKTGFPAGKLTDAVVAAFAQIEANDPQFGLPWLENLATHALDEAAEAVVFVAGIAADNFVALPMKLVASNSEGHALGTFYTSAYRPLIHSASPQPLLAALFKHLIDVEKLSTLTLAPLAADADTMDLITAAMHEAGWRGIHRYSCFGNWTHDLQGNSWSAYLASRPSKVRNTVKRRTRKFLHDGNGQLELLDGGSELNSAIERFVAVYNKSWKKPEPFPGFMPGLLRLAADRGWLRLGIASYKGQAVACQLWLVADNTAYIFKLAYDEQYKQLSPGTVLTAFMMEHVIDRDAVTRIDYLSGDDTYKQDWMSIRTERQGIAAYNPRSLKGLVMLLGHSVKAVLKR